MVLSFTVATIRKLLHSLCELAHSKIRKIVFREAFAPLTIELRALIRCRDKAGDRNTRLVALMTTGVETCCQQRE